MPPARKEIAMPKGEHIAETYLGWRDFARMFDCGRSKALLMMHEVGVVYIGHAVFVKQSVLDAYIDERGSIDITWPLSAARRKETRHGRKG